jgi:hypothetical protein
MTASRGPERPLLQALRVEPPDNGFEAQLAELLRAEAAVRRDPLRLPARGRFRASLLVGAAALVASAAAAYIGGVRPPMLFERGPEPASIAAEPLEPPRQRLARLPEPAASAAEPEREAVRAAEAPLDGPREERARETSAPSPAPRQRALVTPLRANQVERPAAPVEAADGRPASEIAPDPPAAPAEAFPPKLERVEFGAGKSNQPAQVEGNGNGATRERAREAARSRVSSGAHEGTTGERGGAEGRERAAGERKAPADSGQQERSQQQQHKGR